MAEIQLLPVWKNKRPPFLIFFSSLWLLLWPYHSNRRAILYQAIEFRPNRATRCGVITSYTISRWRPRRLRTTFGFVLVDVSVDQILPENQTSSKSDHPRRRYNLLVIFKMAAAAAQYYFRCRIWWCHSLPKVNIYPQTKFNRHILIHGWDITTSGLKKTTGRHIEILVPVSILTMPPCSACHFALGCQMLSKSVHPQRRYVILIFMIAAAAAQFYFRFQIGDVALFRMSLSISKSNIVVIAQFTAEI